MAYDRYDRDERSRWSDNRGDRDNGGRDERGFWDRASDEVASWFGDDDAERRRRQDARHEQRMSGSDQDRSRGDNREHSAFGRGWGGSGRDQDRDYDRGYGRDYARDRATYNRDESSYGGNRSDRDFNYDRGVFNRGGSSDRDYNRDWRSNFSGDRSRNSDRSRSGDRDYQPMTGDYGREGHESAQFFAASGYGRNDAGRDQDHDREGDRDRERFASQTPYGRDQYRRTSYAGSRERNPERDFDPGYRSWRDRHMSDLDRDYDDYRRENQSRFESDFGSWRENRQQKRGVLAQVHEHMDVVGNDGKHVGTVDKVGRDRIILTKSDPDSGGVHHSLSCSDIECVKDGKVVLDCSADEAKHRWHEVNRDDQGQSGPHNLNRSFEGTYR